MDVSRDLVEFMCTSRILKDMQITCRTLHDNCFCVIWLAGQTGFTEVMWADCLP